MGYIHEQGVGVFVQPGMCAMSAGTWTNAEASNVWSMNRTAAAAAFKIQIPATILHQVTATQKGSYLTSVDLFWEVETAALTTLTGYIYKMTNPANGGAWIAASQAFGYDTSHLTNANRVTVALHKMTMTLTTPFWIQKDYHAYALLDVDAPAASVFKLYGAQWNYTLRI